MIFARPKIVFFKAFLGGLPFLNDLRTVENKFSCMPQVLSALDFQGFSCFLQQFSFRCLMPEKLL